MIFALFMNSFCYVGLKVWQQKNVIGNHYGWMVPTSYLMALAEVYGVSVVSHSGFRWAIVLAVGSGAWMGGVLAMWAHNRFQTRATHEAEHP